ncbi:inosine-5-monophosphate dehydrogenase [Caballeronia jiangsuensis]|nr:inosine-5-monophosphate dehydrogenase [Caballeronia jiangsuensis]
MLVKDMMHRAVCVTPRGSLATAVRKLADKHIGCLPVCDGSRPVGMLTDRDIAMRASTHGRDLNDITVREVMRVGALCCSTTDPIEEAIRLMHQSHVRRLMVLDRKAHVVGVISAGDIDGFLSQPRPFEVIFYKEVLDHLGHSHRSELMRISIAHCTREEAVRMAILEFEETRRLSHWNALADGYEVLNVRIAS